MSDTINALKQAGLSENEAQVYQILLEYGQLKASDVIRRSGLKRGNVYNLLHALVQKDLVKEGVKNGIATYQPLNPNNLITLLNVEYQQLKNREQDLERALPIITQVFNQGHHRPSVQIYEGSSGVLKALHNTLDTSEVIYTYVDFESVQQFMSSESQEYIKKRNKIGVKKRILVFDNDTGRSVVAKANTEFSEYRFIKPSDHPLEAYLEIYDNKLTYLTISKSNKLAVEINDKRLYYLHRHLFEIQWEQAKALNNMVK